MSSNPIQYTSRTFQTILADINADSTLADKPEWFKRMIAGVGDVLSFCLDAQANNSYLDTAFTRTAVKKLCALIGYKLGEQTTSTGKLKFYLTDNTVFPLTVTKSDLVAVYGRIASMKFQSRSDITVEETIVALIGIGHDDHITVNEGIGIPFETLDKVFVSELNDYYYLKVNGRDIYFARSVQDILLERWVSVTSGTYTCKNYTLTCQAYQQDSKDSMIIGNSDGSTVWQEFDLPDTDVLPDTLSIMINDEVWTRVEDFSASQPTSKHYVLNFNNDNTSYIVFGNGTYGQIPENFPIYAQYSIGGGGTTNISTINAINIYAGSHPNIEGVSNTAFTGGSDPESIISAKILAPASLKTRDRFVTVDDGLALIYRTGYSSIACIWSNYYGSLSCKVNCVAKGGGNLSADNRLYIQQFLKDRSVLGSVDVRVVDTVFNSVSLNVQVSLNTGFTLTEVAPYVQICCKLFFTECGKEIVDTYESSGLESAINLINTIFSSDFSTTDSQLQTMLFYLQKFYRKFGDTVYESNLVSMISACVDGINHLTVSDIFPIVNARDEITTCGTFTVTEEVI